MKSDIVKRAIRRDPTAPMGEPASLYWIQCGCDRCVPAPRDLGADEDIACPTCGTVYDRTGWVLTRGAA